jgi:hypothetical protein
MKKADFSFTAESTDLQEAIDMLLEDLSDADLRNFYQTTHTCVTNGDIWHKHYFIKDGKLIGTFIFDSDDAYSNWSGAATLLESLPNHLNTELADITFEEFAAIAQEADVEFINQNPRKTALDDEFGLV